MDVSLCYGSHSYTLNLPAGSSVLHIQEPESVISKEYFAAQLQKQLDRQSLDLSDTIIIVADKTRVCGYANYLPVLVDSLIAHGLPPQKLRFIIGYGTHSRQSDAECLNTYGSVYREYPFLHHDCSAVTDFVSYGVTSKGTPIRLRRDIHEASCVITMGPICHHYFAGYGGGRKLIFPGCGEKEAIYANHGLFLDTQNKQLSPHCQPGVLTNNPLAEDLFEIANARQADLAIHGIMNSRGELCDSIIGSGTQTYLQACNVHSVLCEIKAPQAPFVIASCGGFPKDINFIQSHKAIHNASMFVEDGGTLLIFSECRDGIGSQSFLPWFDKGGFSASFRLLSQSYVGNGGTALAMMTKTKRIRIKMVTDLDDALCRKIGVEKCSIGEATVEIHKRVEPLTCIANASLLVRKTPA